MIFIEGVNKMGKTKTTAEFIRQAIAFHGDKFDYSKMEYIHSNQNIIIFCKKGNHEFFQKPNQHLRKGCFECSGRKLLTKEQFLEKIYSVHNNKYDYSKMVWVNTKTKISIICKIHGDFLQIPSAHLAGHDCPKCSKLRQTKTRDQFIMDGTALYGDKYDYSKVQYVNDATKVMIGCKIHGFFEQLPHNHLSKGRNGSCKKCGIASYTKSKEQFIIDANKIHNNKYDYSKVEYVNNKTKIIIVCPEHGNFTQNPCSHIINKTGCPNCLYKTEQKLYDKISFHYPFIIRQLRVEWCKNIKYLPFDFFIPSSNIIIELDGIQHREQVGNWNSPKEIMERDKYKQKSANENGYSVIRILQEDVLLDKYDWLTKLLESIQYIMDSKTIINLYLHNQNEYDTFIKLFDV